MLKGHSTGEGGHQISRWFEYLVIALAIAFLIISISQPAKAQVLYGSIVGEVTDSTGAVVPGAAVMATAIETDVTHNTTTNGAGLYTFSAIPAGTYDVSISAPGFSTFNTQKIVLRINTVVRVDATLQVGAKTTTVTVLAEGTLLQTDKTDTHTDITARELADLPQATRTYEGILALVPGVAPPNFSWMTTSGGSFVNPGKGEVIAANGTSNEGTDVRIEGVSDVTPWIQFFTSLVPSTEAIETVNMVTNSPDFSQGLASGATINVTIKSGTNHFHGEVYEFNLNNGMMTRPFFTPVNFREPKNIDNTFGATLGGPIKKDKLFFFAAYEEDLLRQASGEYATVPTAAMLAGDFSATGTTIYNPNTGNPDGTGKIPFSGASLVGNISPIIEKLLVEVPAPNTSAFGTYSNNFFGTMPTRYTLGKLDTKVDWNISSKLRIFGRFDDQPFKIGQHAILGDELGVLNEAGSPTINQSGGDTAVTAGATYTVTPNFVVDGSWGFTRYNAVSSPWGTNQRYTRDTLGIPGTNLGPLPGGGGMARFYFTGNFTEYGEEGAYTNYTDPVLGYAANATWVRGSHTLKFGINLFQEHMNHIEPGPDSLYFTGGVTALNGGPAPNQFNTYADFELGLPTSWNNAFQLFTPITWRGWGDSLYVGDKWAVTRKITFSYGTGWEYYPVSTHKGYGPEWYNFSTHVYEVCGYGGIPKGCGIRVAKDLFAPKVGIAYRPTETVVIRAGYALSYEQANDGRDTLYAYPETLGYTASSANPFVPVGTLTAGIPILPTPDYSQGVVPLPAGASFEVEPAKFVRGYTQSYNLTAQKRFGQWLAQVAYVGSHNIKGHAREDINYGLVGGGPASDVNAQYFGTVQDAEIEPQMSSDYNSLQAILQRHFANGLQLNANYTYSKWIGICCSTNADGGDEIPIPQYYNLNRAVEPGDVRHIFNFLAMYQLPFGKGKHYVNQGGAGSAILGGWQLNTVLTSHSGSPFSIGADGTSLNAPGSTQRADQVKPQVALPHTLNQWFDPYAFAPVTTARFGTADYDSVYGPGGTNLDLSLFRSFRLSERFSLQFRGECFNLTNTPHFANPGSYVSSVQYATNPDGSPNFSNIVNLNGFDQITSTNASNRFTDQRYFRLGVKILF